MGFPFGKKGFLAASAIAAGVVYYRVKQNREQEALRWEEELEAATNEGVAAAQSAKAAEKDRV